MKLGKFFIFIIQDGMGSIYSDDYAPGYAPHVCTQPHDDGNGLPPPDTSGNDSTSDSSGYYSGGEAGEGGGGAWSGNYTDGTGIMLSDIEGATEGGILEAMRSRYGPDFTGNPIYDVPISVVIVVGEAIIHSATAETEYSENSSGGGGSW